MPLKIIGSNKGRVQEEYNAELARRKAAGQSTTGITTEVKPIVQPNGATSVSPSSVAPAPTAPGTEQLPPPPTVTPNAYTVQKGDSLSAVAQANGLSLRELIDLNPQYRANPNMVQVGANLKLPPKITPPNVPQQSQDIVQNYINEGNVDEDLDSTLKQFQQSLQPGPAPAQINRQQTYKQFRSEYGLDNLEAELNAVRASQQSLMDEITSQKNKAKGDLVSTSVINGRLVKIDAETRDAINDLKRQESMIVDQLNSQTKAVSMAMEWFEADYESAKSEWDKNYARNLQFAGLIQGEQNRVRDDARAYLSSVNQMMQTSGKNWDDVDGRIKAEITKKEVQAGYPQGSLEEFSRSKPKAMLLGSSSGTDANGNNVVTFIYADPETGLPGMVRTVGTGSKDSNGKGAKGADLQKARPVIESSKGAVDGYVDPNIYTQLRSDFAGKHGETATFDDTFSVLLSPQERARLGVGKAVGVDADEGSESLF